mgnify:CR=1 FL=1
MVIQKILISRFVSSLTIAEFETKKNYLSRHTRNVISFSNKIFKSFSWDVTVATIWIAAVVITTAISHTTLDQKGLTRSGYYSVTIRLSSLKKQVSS